jgi:hypothetical protein
MGEQIPQTQSEEQRPRESTQRNSSGSESQTDDGEIPAIRHVGPTLESDPEYTNISARDYSTPEAQISAEAGRADVDQRRMEEDDFDPLSGRTFAERSEPLKTRLPGDTSSDPHSDVGPDNATKLQDRKNPG